MAPVRTRLPRSICAGFVGLLLNAAYLWAFSDPTLWYFVQVAAHPLLGLTLATAVLWLVLARRFSPSALGQVGLAISGAGLALGIAILALGATTPHRLLVDAHVAVSTVGAALLILYVWRTAKRTCRPRIAWALRAVTAVVLVAAGAATIARGGREAR